MIVDDIWRNDIVNYLKSWMCISDLRYIGRILVCVMNILYWVGFLCYILIDWGFLSEWGRICELYKVFGNSMSDWCGVEELFWKCIGLFSNKFIFFVFGVFLVFFGGEEFMV